MDGAAEVEVVGEAPRAVGTRAVRESADLAGPAPLTAGELLRGVPGLTVLPEDGAGLFLNLGVRGLPPARSTRVLVLQDGLPIAPGPYGHPELYWVPPVGQIDRVEVSRGGGTARFGPQTIGGVVDFRSAPAPRGPVGGAAVRAGSFGLVVGRGVAGTGGPEGGLRVEAEARRFDGPRAVNLRAADGALVGERRVGPHRLVARVAGSTQEAAPSYLGLTTPDFARDPRHVDAEDERFTLGRVAGSVGVETAVAPGVRVETRAYAQQIVRAWARQDYARVDDGRAVEMLPSNTQRDRLYAFGGLQQEWAIEGARGRLRGGARVHREGERQRQLAGARGDARGGALTADERLGGLALAGWSEAELEPGGGFTLNAGLRGERFRAARESLYPDEARGAETVGAVLPGGGLSWGRGPWALWAGSQAGWAPPATVDAISPDGTVLRLDAERAWTHEGGLRWRGAGGGRADLTAFWMAYANQVTPPSEAGVRSDAEVVNGAPTRHRGVEAELALARGDRGAGAWVEPRLAGALLDARVRGGPFAGNTVPWAPPWTATAGLAGGPPGPVGLWVGLFHRGPFFVDLANTVAPSADGTLGRVPAWTTVDAALQAEARVGAARLRAELRVRNLPDRVTIASRAPAGIQPEGFRTWEGALAIDW